MTDEQLILMSQKMEQYIESMGDPFGVADFSTGQLIRRFIELVKENQRLLRGDFTPEELQNMNSPGREFDECSEYHQNKLFGRCDSDELMKELDQLKEENKHLRTSWGLRYDEKVVGAKFNYLIVDRTGGDRLGLSLEGNE